MAKMMMAYVIRSGSAQDLDEAIDRSSEWASAGEKGLIGYEVLLDPEDPERATVMTKWHDIDSLNKVKAKPDLLTISDDQVRAEPAGDPTVFVSPRHQRKLAAANE